MGDNWATQTPQFKDDGKQWLDTHVNGHEAVVTGVMGLDGTHDGSEIHPVLALAIRDTSQVDPKSDRWAFFSATGATRANAQLKR